MVVAAFVPNSPRNGRIRARGIAAFAAAAALGLALAAPTPAHATEVLIDQGKALLGNVTPGDAPGFPITISQPGKYKLVGPLVVIGANQGIVVAANNVTIDLNGFTIEGANIASFGIYARSRDNLTVMNGTITGFKADGILHDDSVYGVFDGVKVFKNGNAGILTGHFAQVRHSHLTQNSQRGFSCLTMCHIEGNTIANNKQDGIFMASGLVLGNVISGNGNYGLVAHPIGIQHQVGFGNNTLFANKAGNVLGAPAPLQPNFCMPKC